MDIRPIKNDTDYYQALNRLEVVFDSPIGSVDSDEADVLGLLVDEYEKKNFTIGAPDPIEAIKIRMEDMQLKQKDLIGVIGGKSRVSEILNKRRKLTVEMVRNLAERLNLSSQILIKDYRLVK